MKKKNLEITKPLKSEHILPVPWPFVVSRFHCSTIGDEFNYYYFFLFVQEQLVFLQPPIMQVIPMLLQ